MSSWKTARLWRYLKTVVREDRPDHRRQRESHSTVLHKRPYPFCHEPFSGVTRMICPSIPWLQEKIWPLEAKLTEDDVYWGAKLACLEMIKNGVTVFNDMYWYWEATARAVCDTGIRGFISAVFIDMFDPDKWPRRSGKQYKTL